MTSLIALCRSGYEAILVDELTFRFAEGNVAGYGQFNKASGWVTFHFIAPLSSKQRKDVEESCANLIFARQVWWKTAEIIFENKHDRVSDILAAYKNTWEDDDVYDDVLVEYPDTDAGKDVAKFAKKFTVPLRQALRQKSYLTHRNSKTSSTKQLRSLHILLIDFESAIVGKAIKGASKSNVGGIVRLKFPPNAPSRSTLKLEDAIINMVSAVERERIFYPGANAVDLGACPGGWTYQLVSRGMHVEAIDNGLIDDSLMATGLVEHHAADGFTYKPAYGHVTLLVCDMIEKPDRVATLMCDWLVKGRADHAIFNLKLPMKQRFDMVNQCLTFIHETLNKTQSTYRIDAKHLYHDRDEITVCAIKTQ